MKLLNNFIQEKLKINSNTKINSYKYFPKDNDELINLIENLIEERGNKADLNDIDTSEIDSMFELFYGLDFNGDISKWDVSNVTNMSQMFMGSKFDGDISKWDVSNVINMRWMFESSSFTGKNGDISEWDINNVKYMDNMFRNSPLEKNPPKWYHE